MILTRNICEIFSLGMASQESDSFGGETPKKAKRGSETAASRDRHDSVNSNLGQTTQSGRLVKPSLVIRESTTDSNNEETTPVKRRKRESSKSKSK